MEAVVPVEKKGSDWVEACLGQGEGPHQDSPV